MGRPRRLEEQAGRFALVDGIPFQLPVSSHKSPALMAAFSIDADKAAALMPGNEMHPFRLWNRGLLVITVIDYIETNIGKYIEYSVAIACTHGKKPAPRLLPAIFMKTFGTGQYVVDLPVSTEISVKGGKGIWGMPKHQANLDFVIGDEWVSSQYDLDGLLAVRIDVERPKKAWLPLNVGAINYCAFRGMLMASYIYFKGKLGFKLMKKGSARLTIGDHPRVQALKTLDISPEPLFCGFLPETAGVLDDHFEAWFLSEKTPPARMEGLESVANLENKEEWLTPPNRKD
ncbi:acetoacetate decarboxylase family protein [Uliginosibacterium sp. H3]|uniref:Acetoacetate decarboxylase family protein n=1 Tax=Uliginosibacterium silvisoli TaxID=3114758 RepID=A0ABU6JY58_9RHOO|nr:acetoacetate decarboxylase family protein [Uliginosibacterium sp. H3]